MKTNTNIISKESFTETFKAWILPLLNELIKTTNDFNKFYSAPYHILDLKKDDTNLNSIRVHLETFNYDDLLNHLPENIDLTTSSITFELNTNYNSFKEIDIKPFNCIYQIKIVIQNNKFKILMDDIDNRENVIESGEFKNIISEENINEVNAKWFEVLENHIKVNRYSYEN